MDVSIFDKGSKIFDRYTVIINNKHVYTMSANALSPQGINRYLCDVVDLDLENVGEPIGLKEVPEGVKKAIEDRFSQMSL
jgi:hypothetical protein